MKGIKLNEKFQYFPNQMDELKTFNEKIYRFNGEYWFDLENGRIYNNKIIYNGKSIVRNGILLAKRKSIDYCWQVVV